MPTQRIPLVGSIQNRNTNPDSFVAKDQVFINCYPEVMKNSITGAAKAALYKRPGFTSANLASASYSGLGGALVWSGKTTAPGVFPYLNGTTLGIYDTAGNLLGATISNVTGWTLLTETTYSSLPTLTVTLRKSTDSLQHAYYYKDGDAGWTEITDVDYPVNQTPALTTIGRMIHMDGYAFVMSQDGKIWNSDLNNITSWSATGFIQAQSSPDIGAGLARTKNLIVAFGGNSIEFFQNTGNATGSPLTRIASAAINIGSTTVGTDFTPNFLEFMDSVFFFGTTLDQGSTGFYRLTGTSLRKISTPAIDKIILENIGGNLLGIAGMLRMHGMTHILLYNGTASNVPAYCVDTNTWWYFTNASTTKIRACLPIAQKNYLVGDDRKLLTMDNENPVFQDDGTNITMTVRTQPVDHGTTLKKSYVAAEIVADNRTTSGNTSIQWSDDDYANFSTARTINLSTGTRRVTRLGSTNRNYNNRRAWQITDAVNAPFRAEAIDVTYDVMSA